MSTIHDFGSSKRPVDGLIVGRFLLPHLGHQYLFDFARAYCERLVIVVYGDDHEPIPRAQRLAWIQEMCPEARIRELATPAAANAGGEAAPDVGWLAASLAALGLHGDVLFTASPEADRLLARQIGARLVVVADTDPKAPPPSAAQLLQAPSRYGCYLPPCVRSHFIKRVVICGPESTGKSTLCRDLAAHFQSRWVGEFARSHLDFKEKKSGAAICEPDDIVHIMRGHQAAEDAAARQVERLLILDTDALQTVMYSRFYYADCPPPLVAMASSRHYDLYLVLDVDVPWIADPQRDMPHRRGEILALMRATLDEFARPYVLISGSWQSRREQAIALIDRLLEGC